MKWEKIFAKEGFYSDPGVKHPPCNAGNTGSIPGCGRWGNEAHAPQPSLCSGACELHLLRPHAATPEACGRQNPCSAAREATETELSFQAQAQQQRSSMAPNKRINILKIFAKDMINKGLIPKKHPQFIQLNIKKANNPILNNEQKTERDISLKKTQRWPTGI